MADEERITVSIDRAEAEAIVEEWDWEDLSPLKGSGSKPKREIMRMIEKKL